ncbi:AglZ/HisF2 family acetamidino modification protein [Porticoccaceae bacterium nBUS_17]
MLAPRIIPCLLLSDGGLVKTQKFTSKKYVGDPINAIRIFNEKECDELMVLDIDASINNVEPNYAKINKYAAECRMPLCYGGGIKTVEQARAIIALGVEKIALSSGVLEDLSLIASLASELGSQSVVVVLDVKRDFLGRYKVFTHNGGQATGLDLLPLISKVQAYGAGEIVINSIDRDGMSEGYDLKLARTVKDQVFVPLTFLGGAGSLNDIEKLISENGIIGCAAGSLFVFKGIYRAVLISYPDQIRRQEMIKRTIEQFK